jgi:hypothetical protein
MLTPMKHRRALTGRAAHERSLLHGITVLEVAGSRGSAPRAISRSLGADVEVQRARRTRLTTSILIGDRPRFDPAASSISKHSKASPGLSP